ncbi:MAG: hypothetical protein ACM3ZT_02760 [Bacillota bacterium]
MNRRRKNPNAKRLPAFVRDVSTADCLFCPYGADMEVGDRVYAYDERTEFGRRPRERLVEVTAIKVFRSTGRVVTLDLEKIPLAELARIATISELSMEAVLGHHAGAPNYDRRRPPVVVYFQPCNDDDTVGTRFRLPPVPKREPAWRRWLSRIFPEFQQA